jgi:hypothetical protein
MDRVTPAPGVVFRPGDVLIYTTTGTIVTPLPVGSMAALPGPVAAAITFGTSASAAAPGGTYYHYIAYTATTNQSLPSGPWLQFVPPGFLPTVTVSATAGSPPAAATNFAVFSSLLPTFEALQQATTTTTALGSTFTLANPLTTYIPPPRAATGVSSGIIGIANDPSDSTFWSDKVGNKSAFGQGQSQPPLDSLGALSVPIIKCQTGLFDMSLKQAYSPALIGAAVGITLDATSGFFIADTTQTQVGTIQGQTGEPYPFGWDGTPTGTGARVRVAFLNSVLA